MNDIQLRAYEAISNAAQEYALILSGSDDELSDAIQNAVINLSWS